MNFDELDRRMRIFETAHDHRVLPGLYMVARLDGRTFTRLTREVHDFAAPFDELFRDLMIATTRHLMEAGFRIVYGYTQSDEISLLFHREETAFSRKLRKLNSILAGEASARFSTLMAQRLPSASGDVASFDCRISQLPRTEYVIDYFRWRAEDAHRNALNSHCYWALRREGMSVRTATRTLEGLSVAGKNELLFQRGINFNELPAWHKRGVGLCWDVYTKGGVNPLTGETVTAQRRRIKVELALPMKDDYDRFLAGVVAQAGA